MKMFSNTEAEAKKRCLQKKLGFINNIKPIKFKSFKNKTGPERTDTFSKNKSTEN